MALVLRPVILYTKDSRVDMMKTLKKVLIFFIVFAAVWFLVQPVFAYDWNKTENMGARYESYAAARVGEFDVLWIGSSNVYADICPPLIWHNNGITGFNMGTANNFSLLEYYQLKHLLNVNKPQLVVMELSGISVLKSPDENFDLYEPIYRKIIDTMPDYGLRLQMIKEVCSRYESLDVLPFLLPLIRYHDRWEEIDMESIKGMFEEDSYNEYRKGAYFNSKVMSQEWPGDVFVYENEVVPLYDEYYQKMVDLCKEEGIEVLIMLSPKVQQRYADYEGAKNLAERNGLNFISFTKQEEFMAVGLDTKMDFYDDAHLNILGQYKFSKFMGDYISRKYGLTDHRGDAVYADWDGWYEDYLGRYKSKENDMTFLNPADDGKE